MSEKGIPEKGINERLDKVIKRLDILAVILLVKSGLTRKEIADVLGVSGKTIERLIPVSKLKGARGKKLEVEELPQPEAESEMPKEETEKKQTEKESEATPE
jgi:transposase